MSHKTDALLAEVLLENLPKRIRKAYKLLARIEYPITDRKAFLVQLDDIEKRLKRNGVTATSHLDLVRSSFSTTDFPIQSVQSAFEKFYSKQPHSSEPVPVNDPDALPPKLAQPTEVNMLSVYQSRFRDDRCAAACAYEHYRWWLDHSSTLDSAVRDIAAFWNGDSAGRECQRTRSCPGFPVPPGRIAGRLFTCVDVGPPIVVAPVIIPSPIERFEVTHTVCEPAWDAGRANVNISYAINPMGKTITSIEIIRIYKRDDLVPREALVPASLRRLPSGEYSESIYTIAASAIPTTVFTVGPISDAGLEPGRHWGQTLFYHQYRITVVTDTGESFSSTRDVTFGRKPQWILAPEFGDVAGVAVSGSDLHWGMTRMYLDNVREITATRTAHPSDTIAVFPVPINYVADLASRIGAKLCLQSSAGFTSGEEIAFTFLPFDDSRCPPPELIRFTTQIGTGETGCP
jgi:hypothetical protein